MYALLQFIYLPSSVCGIINVMQRRFRDSASMKPESASEKASSAGWSTVTFANGESAVSGRISGV